MSCTFWRAAHGNIRVRIKIDLRSQLETGIIEKFRNAWRLRRFHRSEETNLSIKPIINTLEKAERQNIRFDFMFI